MGISKEIIQTLEHQLQVSVTGFKPVSGGSINDAFKLQTDKELFFLKINDKNAYPGMFEAEATGLKLIAKKGAIKVPDVIHPGNAGNESFLLLKWIESRRPTIRASSQLGMQLAQMHKQSNQYFGLDSDNYMGSLRQSNNKHLKWSSFFVEERLMPMVKTGIDKGLLNSKNVTEFEILYKNIPSLFDEEAPALIHGDLWGGNYLIGEDETPFLIDPAVSYGNREFDIAMTTLFGGFSTEFYQSYNETFPLQKDWQHRIDLWNLYPLLLHLNLFSLSYLPQVKDCLKQYI